MISFNSSSQVGIGNTNPAESSLLDVNDSNNNKGILIPRVDIANLDTQEPITTATITESLLVYNTNITTGKGFYYWGGSKWMRLQASGMENNIYNINGNLTDNRILNLRGNSLNFNSGTNVVLQIDDNRRITLGGYGGNTFAGNPVNILGVNATGQIVSLNTDLAYDAANSDWYEANSVRPPDNIADNIYTNGRVGINTNNPLSSFHIYEGRGTVASPDTGTILLQHGDATGESSIVFRSSVNGNSDYGYIKYQTDGSGNGSGGENGLLTIGVENDVPGSSPQDDINIDSSGSLGINTASPTPSASIDMGRTNQGLLINRVRLRSSTDVTTIIGTEPDGLLVYNTSVSGTYPNNVVEGFYYWDNSRWNLLKDDVNSDNKGVQFYSYNINPTVSPNLNTVERETKINRSGIYLGALNDIAAMRPSNNDGFVIKIVGTYEVKNTGNFTFKERSDDGARIYIDGSLIHNVWNDGAGDLNSSTVNLGKGKHQIEFWYYENAGDENFSFYWGANPDGNTVDSVIQANQLTIE